MVQSQLQVGRTGAFVANALVFLIVVYAALLSQFNSDLYYQSVQEDEFLEWATFWAFVLAGGINAMAALKQRRYNRGLPWFLSGVALFCLIVALEEISWGQRIFGYRPPVYFLEQNYQQEFNLHNVVDTQYRKLALMTVIVGYGILLAGLPQLSFIHRLFNRLGVIAPPIGLLPVFLTAMVFYVWYPLGHSGEWVELILGLGFVFSALAAVRHFRDSPTDSEQASVSSRLALSTGIVVIVLGLLTTAGTRYQQRTHPGNVTAVRSELIALESDFQSGRVRYRCGLHKRLYTFVREYDQTLLFSGRFSELTAQGLPKERAEFFLDPWNSPYWIRDRCASRNGPRTTFVYSLGPNRRRDSSQREVRDDDIGAHIRP